VLFFSPPTHSTTFFPRIKHRQSLNTSPTMSFNSSSPYPEGVISFLDTDLYKLTMQCAVLKYFKDVPVTYAFTNRTPEKKLSRAAFGWLEEQIRSTKAPACHLPSPSPVESHSHC